MAESEPIIESNPRAIPKAPFIEDIPHFLTGRQAEDALATLQDTLSRYKYMEIDRTRRKKAVLEQLPELERAQEWVGILKERQSRRKDALAGAPLTTRFEIAETLYVDAEVDEVDQVYLWLGANVMLSYTTNEAYELLQKKVKDAKRTLTNVDEDLEFLREQITTMEVNTARVWNEDVKNRREKQTAS